MLFVIKLFPEITIKSAPVRRRLIRLLRRNIRRLLFQIDEKVEVRGEWDGIQVEIAEGSDALRPQFVDSLSRIPGIAVFQEVGKYPLTDFDAVAAACMEHYGPQLAGRTFAVRCKRAGKHDFRSVDLESHVGGVLFHGVPNGGVDLDKPQVTVQLEVRDDYFHVVRSQHPGLGGFPLGSQDGVLSLISGGFDSAVSSFQCIRRGLMTHYCFFNLGGKAHELAVKEVALFLWMKYGASHKVKFVSVPFDGVVAEILGKVDDSQMGVILKRMMLRVAERIANRLHLAAIVTGESIAQVSSQTLANLAVIDSVCSKLVLRPLITSDKQDIINIARRIGTEEFSRHIPEYCGVISIKPTTRARTHRIESEEARFDPAVLDRAVAMARVKLITDIVPDLKDDQGQVQESDRILGGDVLVDIRHPESADREKIPLVGETPAEIRNIPFYQLAAFVAEQDPARRLLLYCDRGMMSRLHAAHLQDQGYSNVAVYSPPRR